MFSRGWLWRGDATSVWAVWRGREYGPAAVIPGRRGSDLGDGSQTFLKKQAFSMCCRHPSCNRLHARCLERQGLPDQGVRARIITIGLFPSRTPGPELKDVRAISRRCRLSRGWDAVWLQLLSRFNKCHQKRGAPWFRIPRPLGRRVWPWSTWSVPSARAFGGCPDHRICRHQWWCGTHDGTTTKWRIMSWSSCSRMWQW
jgi:hypothetical protein